MSAHDVPVSVIGGFLGAGKTTLVNHLLNRTRGLRLAVLVNDFGSIAVDADLIVSRSASVISIAGGCVCCSYGSDLVASLQTLASAIEPPAHIVIETSGVALPRVVLQSAALVPGLRGIGVTVVADCATLIEQAADRFIGDTVERQFEDADVILLNKTDLASPDRLEASERWIRRHNGSAKVVRTAHAQVSLPEINAWSARATGEQTLRKPRSRGRPEQASRRFDSEQFVLPQRIHVQQLAGELVRPERRLLRAKGVLRNRDGALQVLQLAGSRVELAALTSATRTGITGLVCIARKGELDRDALASLIRHAIVD